MTKSHNLAKHILVPVITLIAGTSLVFAQKKPSIQDLTSKNTAKNVKSEVQSVSKEVESRIPGQTKVHSVGIGLGQTFVKGDFEDNGEDKITADLLYDYAASHSFDLFVDAHYSKHKYKQRFVIVRGVAVGIKAKLYQFDAFSPFVVGGFGFYGPKVKRMVSNNLVESDSKVVFGNHVGAGGDLRLNDKYSVGLLAHYHNPFDVKQELGPEVEGSYFKLLITTMYTF